jgi:hypothetical protein
MSDEGRRFFSGRRVYDPELARQAELRRQYINDSIYGFVEGLPLGESGEAAETVLYAQPDATNCFYAALGGIATALHGRVIDISALSQRSRAEGLLGQYGAETFSQFQEAQTEFVRREMNVNIRFINIPQDPDHDRLHAVTYGLIEGTHVVFGLPRHWVALDGIRKSGHGRGQATWTGMNPAGARRIEDEHRSHITPQIVVDRLLEGDMPVVEVEGTAIRRWRGRAGSEDERPRRLSRAEDAAPLFRPTGRSIRRAED